MPTPIDLYRIPIAKESTPVTSKPGVLIIELLLVEPLTYAAYNSLLVIVDIIQHLASTCTI